MRPTLLVSLALLLPTIVVAEEAYSPRFARVEQDARILAFDLCSRPAYPKASIRNEETGTVTLFFTIAPTGRIVRSGVERSSGFRDLDKAALVGVSTCKFKPASINGIPVQATMNMQYVWNLE
jgi:protein TonB